MSDTSRTMWESLTKAQQDHLIAIANDRDGYLIGAGFYGVNDLIDGGYVNTVFYQTEKYEGTAYFLTWRGFRIIPPEVAAEIDASLNTSA